MAGLHPFDPIAVIRHDEFGRSLRPVIDLAAKRELRGTVGRGYSGRAPSSFMAAGSPAMESTRSWSWLRWSLRLVTR